MGRGAAAAVAQSYFQLPGLSSLPSLPTRRKSRKEQRSPLLHDPHGVAVGAALRIGLLHHLRGAPSQDRNAVVAPVQHGVAMLSVFAGHGKHGARLAELAATVISRHVRHYILPRQVLNEAVLPGERSLSGSVSSSSSFYESRWSGDEMFTPSMERIVDDAFVEANIAIDETQWSRNSGTTATVCLLRRNQLVVGNCGNACVMVASKKGGKMQIQLLSDSHGVGDRTEKERVERFGGVVNGSSVSDQEERYVLPFTRSLGDMEMRSAGVCQLPTIRTFELTGRETHLILSSQPLWVGDSVTAPQKLADVIPMEKSACPIDVAEDMMKVAFGASGPMYDATILCARLR